MFFWCRTALGRFHESPGYASSFPKSSNTASPTLVISLPLIVSSGPSLLCLLSLLIRFEPVEYLSLFATGSLMSGRFCHGGGQ